MFNQYEKNILIDLIKKAIDEQKERARQCLLANDEIGADIHYDTVTRMSTILTKLNSTTGDKK